MFTPFFCCFDFVDNILVRNEQVMLSAWKGARGLALVTVSIVMQRLFARQYNFWQNKQQNFQEHQE